MGKLKQSLIDEPTQDITLTNIAINKAWIFAMEYNPTTGREQERDGHHYLKEGYIEGFLAGFAYKFGSEND